MTASRSDIRSRRTTAGSSRADRATRTAGRKASNLGSDVKRTLEVPVRLNEQGRARRVSTQEAALLRLREKALKGDARSLDQLLELSKTFNNRAAVEAVGDKALAAEDQAILDAYAASFDPDHQAPLRPGVAEDSGANRDG